jgi:hypothetical protein
MKKALISAAVI